MKKGASEVIFLITMLIYNLTKFYQYALSGVSEEKRSSLYRDFLDLIGIILCSPPVVKPPSTIKKAPFT